MAEGPHGQTSPNAAEPAYAASVDPAEIERFAALADRWWDPDGAFRALHALNPVRIAYVRDALIAAHDRDATSLRSLAGFRLLDVGCGGGLMAEPLCQLGAEVVAIDAADRNVQAARHHAAEQGLAIDYRHGTAEALAADGERFDAVLALEVVEHVADLEAFIVACEALLDPDGALFVATLNRTLAAYALAVVAAERILGWLPVGTHDWSRFVRPADMVRLLRRCGLGITDMRGIAYHPLAGRWSLSRNLSVNYMVCARKPPV